jgi:DNA-binding IclR family transcriptional regulator
VGFAREELTLGSVSVAAPVFDVTGSAVAAISLVTRSSKGNPSRLAPAVKAVSLSASRELRNRSIKVTRTT